ncbi:MAG TPA: TolC family protein [Candidatus Elarobacter sp.]|nr:TolC family protein [Candidatus Elarobacter sp.]
MSRPRSTALALSASIFITSFATSAPALAQTAPMPAATSAPATMAPAPAPPTTVPATAGPVSPVATTAPIAAPSSAPGSAPAPRGQASPTVPGSQPTPGAVTVPGAQPATGGATTPGSNIRGAANPPPPRPAVLPAVPSLPPFSTPVNALPNPDLVGVQQQPFVGLALQDAVAMALQRNTQLAIAQSNRRISNYQIVAAKGAYDVNFQLVPSYSHSVAPVVTAFNTNAQGGPVTTDAANATAGIRGLTRQGGTYSANLVATRVTSDSAFNSYNPFYETALQLAVTQPLLRSRAIDQPRLQIQLAEINSSVASSNALVQASNTIVQVQNAYFDLVSAWQNVAIQEEGLRNASAQAASNARLAARGVVAPTDIVEANTQVDVFQDNVYAAIQNVQRVQTTLKQLLLANPSDPVWFANLVPTTPVAQIPQEPSLDALVSSAIQNRPEVAQVRAQRSQADVNLAFARDQLKPQLDLGLGYTSNGFAGNPLNPAANPLFGLIGAIAPPSVLAAFPTPPAYQRGAFGQSFQNLLDNRYPTYTAQLAFSFPIGQHTGKADLAIAQEQQRAVQINETALIQRFRSEAVNAIQGLREAQYRVIAARSAREAAQRVLLGEQRRFQAGTSTTFLVLQRQLEVANQEGRELQAQTDLDKAIVELNRVSGGIFAQSNVDVTGLGLPTLTGAGANSVLPPITPTQAPPVTRNPSPQH